MTPFTLNLLDGQGSQRFNQVTRFVGTDRTGAFGILARHAPMVALLRHGLARFSEPEGTWRYLSLPGGVLSFSDNTLTIVAVRYFLGTDRAQIVAQLEADMANTDSEIHHAQATLAEIEQSLMRRLAEMSRG